MFKLLFFILLFNCIFAADNYVDVATESGVVRGFKAKDGDYISFLGIPYAAPPIKNLRFKEPMPPERWDDVFYANRTVVCPQSGRGDEDCLIINVFTPIDPPKDPLPVLVYFHGGSFLIGSGMTKGAEHLVKQNVILVTVNYRLGALGFLCLGIEEAPGNAGMKDQVAALRWVQTNIARFGGDPSQVTIYGMSAGGTSVELLILSKLAKGLFQKAIVESGAAESVWAVDVKPTGTAMDFAEAMDFPKTKNVFKLVDYYKQAPADYMSVLNHEYYNNLTDGTFGFVPCVEKRLSGGDSFLLKSPYTLYKKRNYDKVPTLYIYGTLEGLFLRSSDYYELNYKERMAADFGEFMPADLIFDTEEIRDDVTRNVKRFYFGNKTIDDTTLIEYLNYFGDSLIMRGLLNSAVRNSEGGNPVYLMEFAYKGKLGSHDEFYDHLKVAGHGDAMKYVITAKPIEDNADKLTVDRMVGIVTNFMKFTNPIPVRTPTLPVLWPPVHPDSITYLHLGDDLQVFEEPIWERKLFWDNLYEKFRRNILSVNPGLL